MTHSDPKTPNLDKCKVHETVKLLNLSVAQVDVILRESDTSVDTLTESFTVIVESLQTMQAHLMALGDSAEKEEALLCCENTQNRIQAAIMAFQFYDRMQQCLQHVTSNLRGLCSLVESPERLFNPDEWDKFQSQIRARFTMESEKIMFDAIFQGKTVDEAIAAKSAFQDNESNDIELF